MSQQDRFVDAHRDAKCPIPLSGLNETFLGINSGSGKLDHMLNIGKYVTYNSWLPNHALRAVRILSHIMRQSDAHKMVLREFTRTNELANEIRHGFVECLESDLSVLKKSHNLKYHIGSYYYRRQRHEQLFQVLF